MTGPPPTPLWVSPAELVVLLRPYASYILPGVFFGFFLAAAAAVALGDRWRSRQAFVGCFFAGVVVVNFVVPMAPLPFVSWGHFSEPTSEVETHTEIRLVDASGNEVKMDDRMTLEFDAVSTGPMIRQIRSDDSDTSDEAAARHLLRQARAYRAEVAGGQTDALRFPHHGLTSVWTPSLLEEYDRFVGVRMYEMTFVTSPDGTEVVRYDETMVFEAFPSREAAPAPPSNRSTPTRSMNRTGSGQRSSLSPSGVSV